MLLLLPVLAWMGHVGPANATLLTSAPASSSGVTAAPKTPVTAVDYMDASAQAHRGLRRFRAVATLAAVSPERSQRVRYDLDVDGNAVMIRIREPQMPGRAASDRTYFFRGASLVAYDSDADEKLDRPVPIDGTNFERVTFALGQTDDILKMLLSPTDYEGMMGRFKELFPWEITQTTAGVALDREVSTTEGKNLTSFVFGKEDHLLRRLVISAKGSKVEWDIKYETPRAFDLIPPASARKVNAFTVAPIPPKFASKEAEKLSKAFQDGYLRIRSGTILVAGSDGSQSKIVIDGRRLREDQAYMSYAFDGTKLSILDKQGKTFREGKANRADVPEYVAEAGLACDPISRQILQRRVPFREILTPDMTVSTGGSATLDGVACNVLRLTNKTTKASLYIRKDNQLVHQISSASIDSSGKTIATSDRMLRYIGLNGKMDDATFRLVAPSGVKPSALPELKQR